MTDYPDRFHHLPRSHYKIDACKTVDTNITNGSLTMTFLSMEVL